MKVEGESRKSQGSRGGAGPAGETQGTKATPDPPTLTPDFLLSSSEAPRRPPPLPHLVDF